MGLIRDAWRDTWTATRLLARRLKLQRPDLSPGMGHVLAMWAFIRQGVLFLRCQRGKRGHAWTDHPNARMRMVCSRCGAIIPAHSGDHH